MTAISDSEFSRTAWRKQDEVEPSRPAPAPGVRPVLVAELDEHVALLALDLGRERSRADPGHIGLGDAEHPVDVAGPDPRPDARAAGGGVGRGDERIGAVVDVEEGRLGALQHDVAAGVEGLVHELDGVADHRRQAGATSSRYWAAISSPSRGSRL